MHFLSSHKRLLFLLLSFLILAFTIFLLFGIQTVAPTENERYRTELFEKMEHATSFSSFTNALFCYEVTSDSISTSYTLKNPAAYHIPKLDPRLTSFSYKDYEESRKKSSKKNLLSLMSKQLSHFNPASLGPKDQITYSLLKRDLALNEEFANYFYYDELLGSTTGVQANLPVTLGEYPLRTKSDIKTYLTLLKQIPDYFDDIISYEKQREQLGFHTPAFSRNATKDTLTTLMESFDSDKNCFIATFDERIADIDGLTKKELAAYSDENKKIAEKYVYSAYEKIYAYVNSCVASNPSTSSTNETDKSSTSSSPTSQSASTSGYIPDLNTPYGLSSLPDGKDYYALLVKSNTGSDKSVPELISLTDQTLHQALGDVLNIALTDQKAYLYYCENTIKSVYESPEGILEALSLMARESYPSLKKVPTYTVKTVPDSLAASVSPAFYMIPAIDDYEGNTIYINELYTNTENGNLFTTLAHEGFPGHLYQTVYFNDTNPDPVRSILDYPGYVEGWATYAELNSFEFLEYPIPGDSLCNLYKADTIINLALCSRIDLGVNYENWSLADVNAFFEDNGFNSYFAADVYSYVVESPATYLRYFIGYLEIMELKDSYEHLKMEQYTKKDFHQKLLDIGPADFATVRKFLLGHE